MLALIDKGEAYETHPAFGRRSWWWARGQREVKGSSTIVGQKRKVP